MLDKFRICDHASVVQTKNMHVVATYLNYIQWWVVEELF